MNLLHLQKQKGNGHLFIAGFPGWGDVPFKLPSMQRSQQFSASFTLSQDSFSTTMLWEQIFRECVVDEDLAFHREDIPAGIVESIAKLILYLSGLDENVLHYTGELHNTYRSQAMSPFVFMKRTICSAFGGYTFENLDQLDYQKICELFIQAERLMIDGGIIESEYRIMTGSEAASQPKDDLYTDMREMQAQPDGQMRPRPSSSPAVQSAMREANMNALLEARTKAAQEQAQRNK